MVEELAEGAEVVVEGAVEPVGGSGEGLGLDEVVLEVVFGFLLVFAGEGGGVVGGGVALEDALPCGAGL